MSQQYRGINSLINFPNSLLQIGSVVNIGKPLAQIVLRWHIQSDVIVIPKSVNPKRIHENFAIFDFELEASDMREIETLDSGRRLGADPDTAAFK